MSLPTKAQWSDYWMNQKIYPALGSLYHEVAPLFGMFGFPMLTEKTSYKVNWTTGATAKPVLTTAGAPQHASVAPAQVNETFIVEYAVLGGQSYDDIFTDVHGSGFEAAISTQEAIEAIYRNWINGLFSNGTGVNSVVWGFDDYISEAAGFGATRSLDASADTWTNDQLLKRIDSSITKLPNTGRHVCFTSENGYNALYTAIRNVGGTTPRDVAPEDFGFQGLTYRNCTFTWAEELASATASPVNHAEYDFFNIGPSGVMPVAPSSGLFRVDGPKKTKGEFNDTFDIALLWQLLYLSPRAGYQLTASIAN